MTPNLVSLVMQFLTPDVITKIASALGLNRDVAQRSIGGAVPAVLSGLTDLVSNPGGARQLSNMLAQQQPGALDSFKNVIGGSGQKAFTDAGSNMLSGLLGGSTLDTLAQSIGKFAGVGEGPMKPLLGMLGSVVLGALGQHQRNAGLDASGLASLLTSQKSQIASAIPSGLADQLSATGLIDTLQGGLRSGTDAATAATARIGGMSERTMAGASHAASAARSTASSQWPYWVAGLIVLAGIASYFFANDVREKVAELQQPAATQPARQGAETVGLAPAGVTVDGVNLVNRANASVGDLKDVLGGVTDTASATAALPKIKDATAKLDEIGTLSAKLSPEGKSALAKVVTAAMPAINQLCDRVLATPGVGAIAKPAIDELRARLDMLAKA